MVASNHWADKPVTMVKGKKTRKIKFLIGKIVTDTYG